MMKKTVLVIVNQVIKKHLSTNDQFTIHAGKLKSGLRNVLKLVDEKVRRLSLNEQALEKAAASYGSDLVRFTQRNLLRVYPKGMRGTSSNYKPILGWMHGIQMVAFYMQGYGKSLWLMHGMFRANGGCGYVKKPDFLTQKGPPVKTILKVKVYMGDGWRKDFSQTHSHHRISTPRFILLECQLILARRRRR